MARSINAIQDELIEEFECLEDWLDRYQLIIDYGKELPQMSEADKNDQNLIDGCQSKVWFTALSRQMRRYRSTL